MGPFPLLRNCRQNAQRRTLLESHAVLVIEVIMLPNSRITTAPAKLLGNPAILVIVVKVLPNLQVATAPASPLGSPAVPCDCGKDASQFANHNVSIGSAMQNRPVQLWWDQKNYLRCCSVIRAEPRGTTDDFPLVGQQRSSIWFGTRGVGSSNPLSPTNPFSHLQAISGLPSTAM